MDKVEKLLRHDRYLEYIEKNSLAENTREFCRHGLQHALDTARVAYILALEGGCDISKETIYLTALLHDIGKWKQYMDKSDHAEEGALLARGILEDIGVGQPDCELILDAIREHRQPGEKSSPLGALLYKADKSCRLCSTCAMVKDCKRFRDGRTPELYY